MEKKVEEVLIRVHEFLGRLCRDGRCDDHCSECIDASDLADDVWDVLHEKEPENDTLEKVIAEIRRDIKDGNNFYAANLPDRLEAIAKRAYNDIDSVVCGIEDASHYDIDDVRKAMDNTIGDYYE